MGKNISGKIFLSALSGLLFLSGIAPSIYPDTQTFASRLLERIDSNFINLTDYRVEIRETSQIAYASGIVKTNGTMNITSKKELFYIDTTYISGGAEKHIIQLFDGRRLWYYDVNNKLVQKVELFRIPARLRDVIQKTLNKHSFTIPEGEYTVSESFLDSMAIYIFELKEKKTVNNQVYEKVRFMVNKDTLFPVKQEMTVKIIPSSGLDEKMEIIVETTREYSGWKTNTGIPDYKFVLALSDDVKIVDVSQETKEKLIELFMPF